MWNLKLEEFKEHFKIALEFQSSKSLYQMDYNVHDV